MNNKTMTFVEGNDLVLVRLLDAPADKVYRAWTDPVLLRQWFAPKPWSVPSAELDVRAGGTNRFIMRGPDGAEFPNEGVYLEVVPGKRLVMTDAYTSAWHPSPKPFMTLIVTFEEEDGMTRYTARVRHWSEEDRKAHEDMGFHQGWAQCAEQLAALVETPQTT